MKFFAFSYGFFQQLSRVGIFCFVNGFFCAMVYQLHDGYLFAIFKQLFCKTFTEKLHLLLKRS